MVKKGIVIVYKIIKKIITEIIINAIILSAEADFWKIKDKLTKASKKTTRDFYYGAYLKIMEKHGNWIGHRSKFEGTPVFPHGMKGIWISQGARIGKDCIIYQHVTIASNLLIDSKGKGSPRIGNNCYISTGATIIGNVRIGNNCRIGANCVVFKDIPDNSVAVPQPPRIIQKENLSHKSIAVEEILTE